MVQLFLQDTQVHGLPCGINRFVKNSLFAHGLRASETDEFAIVTLA